MKRARIDELASVITAGGVTVVWQRAAIVAALEEQREELAKVCDAQFAEPEWHPFMRNGALTCAAAIRSTPVEESE